MKRLGLFVAASMIAAVSTISPASAQSVANISFAKGASSSTVNGSIQGYKFVDYRVVVRAGQILTVNLTRTRGSPYFNVMEPGEKEVAIFVGSSSGDSYSGTTAKSGAYTIRVYQMRNEARRGSVAGYRLMVGVTGGSSIGHATAPVHHSADALVPGTPYHATSLIRCRTVMGGQLGNCKAGVVRRPGSATVHLDTPDGGERTILFRDGKAVSSDSETPIRVERRGDTSIIRIGAVEIYEIPDALPFGG